MPYHQERTAVFLIFGVIILLAVSSYLIETAGKETFAAPFSETLEDDTLAVLRGTITAATNTKTGGHLMLTVNTTAVFIPDGALDDPKNAIGDHVRVIGTVQTYQGKKEILVGSPEDVVIRPQ